MDTDEAEQLMMPFFPHDPYLAVQSLSSAMFENEGFRVPDWIWEAVVQHYFTYLQIQRVQKKEKYLREQLRSEDPFHLGTIPYSLLEYPPVN